MSYTFVTVAHHDDAGWLRLQARSLQQYLPRPLLAEFIIVENSTPGVAHGWAAGLRTSYGDLADLLRVVPATDIADMPRNVSGWFSQQILKLMVSSVVHTERYVLLDAKNHLVFPLQRSFLEARDRIRSCRMSYGTHPMRPFFEVTMRCFGLDPHRYMNAFLPTTTPFTLPAAVVRDLVRDVALRESRPFPAAFLNLGVSEFFLFGAYIISLGGTISDFYDLSGLQCLTIWEENAALGTGEIARLISKNEDGALPFFAVHRRAVGRLTDDSRALIASYWYRRGLFGTSADGVAFLEAQLAAR